MAAIRSLLLRYIWWPRATGRQLVWALGAIAFVGLGFYKRPVVPGVQTFEEVTASTLGLVTGSILLATLAGSQLWRQVRADCLTTQRAAIPFVATMAIGIVAFPILTGLILAFQGSVRIKPLTIDWNLTTKVIYLGEAAFASLTIASYLWAGSVVVVPDAIRLRQPAIGLLGKLFSSAQLAEGDKEQLEALLASIVALTPKDLAYIKADDQRTIAGWIAASRELYSFIRGVDARHLPGHPDLPTHARAFEQLRSDSLL